MDIFKGLCIICSENTLVLSGKDKQKFIELLKEHYFDVNQINDNKFLLQFKEKRSEKSICLSCAYVINCYVNVRNKYIETKAKTEAKCSICRIETNLTNGTNKLIEDALSILKNVNKSKKIPKLTLICLECCFCIISWNKVKNIILQYLQSENGEITNMKKRKLSGNEDLEVEDQFAVPKPPLRSSRRTRSMSVTIEPSQTFLKDSPKKNAVPDKKKIKTVNNDSFPLDTKLRHLSNVKREMLSKDIHLNNKITNKVMSDEKMMYHIAYISCDSDNNTPKSDTPRRTLRKNRSQSILIDDLQTKKSPETLKNNKRKTSLESATEKSNKKIKNAATKNNYADDAPAENDDKTTRKLRKSVDINKTNNETYETPTKIKHKVNKKSKNTDIIEKTEGETEENTTSSPVRTSTRINKGKPRIDEIEVNTKIKHPCSKCRKTFVKKYKSYLHELEHDSSYSPVVKLTKEQLNPIDSDSKFQNEISTDVDTLVKQVVNDTILQLENEISKNIVNQVVDDTLSEIENKISEDETGLKEQELSDKTENSNNENDNHEHLENKKDNHENLENETDNHENLENENCTDDQVEENKKTETESSDCENKNIEEENDENGENLNEEETEKISNGIEQIDENKIIESNKDTEKNSNNNDTNESNNKETGENSNDCETHELNDKETERTSNDCDTNDSKNEEISPNTETNDAKNEEMDCATNEVLNEENDEKENDDENCTKESADNDNIEENSANNKIVENTADDDKSSNDDDSDREIHESENNQKDDSGSTLRLCVENDINDDDEIPNESNIENSEISTIPEIDTEEKENNIHDNHTDTNEDDTNKNGVKSDVEEIEEIVQNSKTDKYENVESLLEDLGA